MQANCLARVNPYCLYILVKQSVCIAYKIQVIIVTLL